MPPAAPPGCRWHPPHPATATTAQASRRPAGQGLRFNRQSRLPPVLPRCTSQEARVWRSGFLLSSEEGVLLRGRSPPPHRLRPGPQRHNGKAHHEHAGPRLPPLSQPLQVPPRRRVQRRRRGGVARLQAPQVPLQPLPAPCLQQAVGNALGKWPGGQARSKEPPWDGGCVLGGEPGSPSQHLLRPIAPPRTWLSPEGPSVCAFSRSVILPTTAGAATAQPSLSPGARNLAQVSSLQVGGKGDKGKKARVGRW